MFAFFNARSGSTLYGAAAHGPTLHRNSPICYLDQLMSPAIQRAVNVERVASFPHCLFNGAAESPPKQEQSIKTGSKRVGDRRGRRGHNSSRDGP